MQQGLQSIEPCQFPFIHQGGASACAATEARVAGSRFHGIIFLPHRRPNYASVFTLTRCPFIVHGRSITCKRLITASCPFAWLRFNSMVNEITVERRVGTECVSKFSFRGVP